MPRDEIKEEIQWRYERKFVLAGDLYRHIESMIFLHPAVFSEAFPERRINNIYLDYASKECFLANRNGIDKRKKIRIRWYGDDWSPAKSPILEVKIKNENLGAKKRYALKDFDREYAIDMEFIEGLLLASDVPNDIAEELKFLDISVANRYLRRYYVSLDNKFRITIDRDIEYIDMNFGSHGLTLNTIKENNTVVELKYAEDQDASAMMITNHFPFRLARNSKYVNALRVMTP